MTWQGFKTGFGNATSGAKALIVAHPKISGGVVGAGIMCWLLWGFWLAFIGLTILYAIVAVGIIYLVAKYYAGKRNPPFETKVVFLEYARDNNTWFWALLGATALTFLIATQNFGPAVLLPENTPTPEQRATASDIFDHIMHGNNAKPQAKQGPLPWATGTWFWWKAWPLFFLAMVGYGIFAFSDELSHAWQGARQFFEDELADRKRKAAAAAAQPAAAAAGTTAAPPPPKWNFFQFAKWDLIMEAAIKFAMLFWEKYKANRP
jgi:hypothetical protein